MSIPHPMTESDLSPLRNLSTELGEDRMGDAVAPIGRMAKGDGTALAELYEMWNPVLLGSALRMLGDHHEAEEVIQDAFVRIWHRSAGYDVQQSPPFAWAFAVIHLLCSNKWCSRESSISIPNKYDPAGTPLGTPPKLNRQMIRKG